jgi:hypothetical protein
MERHGNEPPKWSWLRENHPHFAQSNWRKCTGRPDCGCWVCLDKVGASLPEAREPEEQKQTDGSLVAELARLSTFEYDRKRKAAAKAIGITVATLDKAVAEERGRANAEGRKSTPLQGRAMAGRRG